MALNLALYTQSAVSISTTEYSLTNNSTTIATKTDNVVITIWIELVNMIAGDEYEIALREKVVSGGTQRKNILANLIGVQGDPMFVSGPFHVGQGWDVTMTRIAGADRTFSWSIRAAS